MGVSSATRPRYEFTAEAIRASLDESLEKLRRSSVDVFLAHEPHPEDLCDEVEDRFRSLVRDGLVSAYGVGVDARGNPWARFGSIWQSRWPGEPAPEYRNDVTYIFHGVVRSRYELGPPTAATPVSSLLRAAVDQAPNSIFLVSASSPKRLRELLQEIV